ncbi:MAG: glycosyltransferase family 9 protein [Bacteroidetes bacterium]|nr:glycosyltransferase family 9 protein [Bacteroidota bacterium]MBU1116035.1 glycosyltransferase family 9 protein [Bacteroidota bacterium]MBU1799197.1 glycosyltransferase family 9 protein [Bacteroidota bacterium]
MKLIKVKRILVIRLSSLGDVLLTTPLLRVLKFKFPSSQIDYLIKSGFLDAIKLNPNLSRIISWQSDKDFEAKLIELKKNNYDLIIDLQNNLRSKKIVSKLGKNSFTFKKPNIKKFLLVKFKLNLLKDEKSIPQRYVEVLPDLKMDNKGLELFLPEELISKISDEKEVIGLAPGAFHYTKRWPLKYYAEIGNMLIRDGFSVAIFGGKSDREICNELKSKINGSIDLSNDDELLETAVNMKKCMLVVCNDSGLMHTATAVGTPVISVFGSSVKEFGFAPFGVKNLIIENNKLTCRPCSHIGKSSCKKKHFKCMNDLTPNLVYEKVNQFMSNL